MNELTKLVIELVKKMDKMHSSPEFKSVWMIAKMHGAKYTGETYEHEFAAVVNELVALGHLDEVKR